MAIITDADGNLVDTENRIQFSSEYGQYTPDYFGANSPMRDSKGNTEPFSLQSYYDPAFGGLQTYRSGDTSYPQDDILPFYNVYEFDKFQQIPNLQRTLGNPRFSMEPTGIMKKAPVDMVQQPLKDLGFDTSYRVANEDDEEQEFLPEQERSGIEKLLQYLPFGEKSVLRQLTNLLPKQDPRATGIRNFYSPEGLTSTGQIASGIMKGYNPVSGGFLNKITGGRFGQPTNYGLAGAMQRRIENILGRRAAQTDASSAKVAELRNLQRAEIQDRSDRGESLGSIGRSTFSGPGMAFERQSGGVSGKGTANERNYGGR